MRKRWEFLRYDSRDRSLTPLPARGWQHEMRLGPLRLIVGFQRGERYRKIRKTDRWRAPRVFAEVEILTYFRRREYAIYPKVRIPRSWL